MVRLKADPVTQGRRGERDQNGREQDGREQDGQKDLREQSGQDVSRPQIQWGKLKEVRVKDYAIRFVFGGVISVIAALIGHWVNTRFGGVFTAFPAILLASLTLIGKHDGKEQSAQDAQGATVGAAAFIVIAIFIALTVTQIAGAASLLLALVIWTALAVGLYFLCVRVGLLRTYASDAEEGKQGDKQRDMQGNQQGGYQQEQPSQ